MDFYEWRERHTDSQTVSNNNNNNNTAANIEIQGIAITHIIHSFSHSFIQRSWACHQFHIVISLHCGSSWFKQQSIPFGNGNILKEKTKTVFSDTKLHALHQKEMNFFFAIFLSSSLLLSLSLFSGLFHFKMFRWKLETYYKWAKLIGCTNRANDKSIFQFSFYVSKES